MISIDVLGHWLSLMHVHHESEQAGVGCRGAWLPREQILGEESRRRVPPEFIAQVHGAEMAREERQALLLGSTTWG